MLEWESFIGCYILCLACIADESLFFYLLVVRLSIQINFFLEY